MKPLLLAGLALALSVPAWSQPQGGPPDDGPDQPNGPVQLQNPHRRGNNGGAGMMNQGQGGDMMGPGQGGGMMSQGLGGNMMPFPSARMMAPPPVSMFADDRYLFILRGDTLMQFDKKSLTLLKSVELPRPLDATDTTPEVAPDGQLRSRTSPPLLRREGVGIGTGGQGPQF